MKRIPETIITKRHLALCAATCLAMVSAQAQVIFSENFDAQTVGANPTGFTTVSPGTAIPGTSPGSVGVTVVDLGGGNHAANLFDYSSSANARLEQDYSPMSGSHLSLTFQRNADLVPVSTTYALYLAFGPSGASVGSSANRAFDIRLYNDGTYRLDAGSQNPDGSYAASGSTGSASFESAGPTFGNHTLDIYAYGGTAGDAGLNYTGPDGNARVLDAHSYAVYLDDTLITPSANATANGNFAFNTSTSYSSTDLGHFGFVTCASSAYTNVDFVVDNLVLSDIPVSTPLTLSNYQAIVTGQNPNYYFTFDDGSLTSTGTNANALTLLSSLGGPPYPQVASDIFGNPTDAIYFSASSDLLVDPYESSDLIVNSGAGGIASSNSTATGSIVMLFRSLDPGTLTAQKYILGGGYTGASHNMMSLYFEDANLTDPGSLKLRYGDQTETILQASNVVADTWYYFAFTYTEATNGYFFDDTGTNLVTVKGKWYVGVPGNTLASGLVTNAIDAVAGNGTFYLSTRDGASGAFRSPGNGMIDEFASWTRRLSDAEVQTQFDALPAIKVVPPSTLAAYQNVVVTNQGASYFFPLAGDYADAIDGSVILQTNYLTSGSYDFGADWFGDVPGAADFSAAHAALTTPGNLLSGGGIYTGAAGSGKGSISCLFFAPSDTNFASYAAIYQAPGATTTTNAFYLRFNRSTSGSTANSLTLYFGDSSQVILPATSIAPGSWYYFAMSYDESLTSNQVNWWLGQPGGTLNSGTISAAPGSLAGDGSTLTLGNSPTFGSPFRASSSAPGYLADFAIWQRVLTTSEVTNQFNALVASSTPAEAPVLSITMGGGNVILSWPAATDSGYNLEFTTSLSSPAWSTAGTPAVVGGEYRVTNTVTASPRFYRLQK